MVLTLFRKNAVEVGDHRGARPSLLADEVLDDLSLAINNERFRGCSDPILGVHVKAWIEKSRHCQIVLFIKSADVFRIDISTDSHDVKFPMLEGLVEYFHIWHFSDAGDAVCCPEVKECYAMSGIYYVRDSAWLSRPRTILEFISLAIVNRLVNLLGVERERYKAKGQIDRSSNPFLF